MTSRERVLNILSARESDRAAVLCPGGMMSMAVTEVMIAEGAAWPAAHSEPDAMLRLALAMQEATGFDNIAVPFCMTVEAESYGATVDLGGTQVHPRVKGTVLPPDGVGELPTPDFRSGRCATLLKTLRRARELRPKVALVGNLVGPFSLLGMLADPLRMLRWTRRAPEVAQRHLQAISAQLVQFGRLQVEAGADVVCIAEPTATGEILGADLFRSLALPYLNRIAESLRSSGAGVIIHICGDVRAIEKELFELEADAVSFDSMVDIRALAREEPAWQVMGNVSAFVLETGPGHLIRDHCRRLLRGGVRLLAPACGVVPATPAAHLRAMRDSVECDP